MEGPQSAATLQELRFPSPGLRAKHATLGIYIIRYSNSVGVAVSRRRYPQQDSGLKCKGECYYTHSDNALYQFPVHHPAKGNAPGELVSIVTRARAISHEVTYQLLRGHVTTVTSHQCWPRAMPTIPPRRVMYGYKSRKGVAPFHGFALCVQSWCRIFPRTISRISDTNLSAAPAHGRLKRSKIKKEKPNKGLSPILPKGRIAITSPIPTISNGKECLLTD